VSKEEGNVVFIRSVDTGQNNDMLSLRATERDAGVSCRFRIACLQNSWDGKQSGKDSDDKEMCCSLVSLSNRVASFLYRMLARISVPVGLIWVCVLRKGWFIHGTVLMSC
jgi:hypothetical protein